SGIETTISVMEIYSIWKGRHFVSNAQVFFNRCLVALDLLHGANQTFQLCFPVFYLADYFSQVGHRETEHG
ncbi:MAG TPA: hypothetical protein VJM50_19935, partial [Pyrinomonadaceae bacterium]|nr:hypothetical protein [Pyrinomonadaceae bacterium]